MKDIFLLWAWLSSAGVAGVCLTKKKKKETKEKQNWEKKKNRKKKKKNKMKQKKKMRREKKEEEVFAAVRAVSQQSFRLNLTRISRPRPPTHQQLDCNG